MCAVIRIHANDFKRSGNLQTTNYDSHLTRPMSLYNSSISSESNQHSFTYISLYTRTWAHLVLYFLPVPCTRTCPFFFFISLSFFDVIPRPISRISFVHPLLLIKTLQERTFHRFSGEGVAGAFRGSSCCHRVWWHPCQPQLSDGYLIVSQ